VIIEMASTGTALAVSKIMPYVVAALLIGWTNVYGKRSRRRGERLAAAQLSTEPGGPRNCRMWPRNPSSRSGQTLHADGSEPVMPGSPALATKLNRKFLYRWP
jgi:hypothetical protein